MHGEGYRFLVYILQLGWWVKPIIGSNVLWFWEDVSEFNTTNTTLLKNQGYIIFHDSEEKLSDALLMTANKPIRALPEFMHFLLLVSQRPAGIQDLEKWFMAQFI